MHFEIPAFGILRIACAILNVFNVNAACTFYYHGDVPPFQIYMFLLGYYLEYNLMNC